MRIRSAAVTVSLALAAARAAAAPAPVPNTFSAGTPARAAEVNANFAHVVQQIALAIPAGVMLPFGGATAPAGYLACDGAAVSRATYAALFAAIGTSYGTGDGSTTFNVPDLRGAFVRGTNGASASFGAADVDSSANRITVTAGHGLNRAGFPIRFTSDGSLPGGLTAGVLYYAIPNDATHFQVAITEANAVAGIAWDLTSGGAGTHAVVGAADPDGPGRTASAPGGATGNAIGSRQGDALQDFRLSHTGRVASGGSATDVFSSQMGITYAIGPSGSAGDNVISRTTTAGFYPLVPVNANVAGETRPRNISVNWIIRY